MAFAENKSPRPNHANKVEYIELTDSSNRGTSPNRNTGERRASNRARIDTLVVNRIIKRDIFKLWQQIKSVPYELVNISFTGIGIKSKDLIRIGDTIELSLSCAENEVKQVLPVRIRNHYREESGHYAYGGTLEHLLDSDFRRLIVKRLTRLDST